MSDCRLLGLITSQKTWNTDETGFQIRIDFNCFHIHIELRSKQTKMVIVFINGIFIKTTIIITEKSYNVSVPMSVTYSL